MLPPRSIFVHILHVVLFFFDIIQSLLLNVINQEHHGPNNAHCYKQNPYGIPSTPLLLPNGICIIIAPPQKKKKKKYYIYIYIYICNMGKVNAHRVTIPFNLYAVVVRLTDHWNVNKNWVITPRLGNRNHLSPTRSGRTKTLWLELAHFFTLLNIVTQVKCVLPLLFSGENKFILFIILFYIHIPCLQ